MLSKTLRNNIGTRRSIIVIDVKLFGRISSIFEMLIASNKNTCRIVQSETTQIFFECILLDFLNISNKDV
jgi:hypothetical protein